MQIAAHTLFDMPLPRPELVPGIHYAEGWHTFDKPILSYRRKASISVAAAAFPEPVPVAISLAVFGAAATRPRRLRIDSPGHAPVDLPVVTDAPITTTIQTPRHEPGAEWTSFTIEIDRIDSPVGLGVSSDERALGVRITALEPGARSLTWPLRFTDPGICRSVLKGGWAEPDPENGIWSTGSHAQMVLPGYLNPDHAPARELGLRLSVLPRPPGLRPLQLAVIGDSAPLWRGALSETTPVLRIPVGNWTANADYTLSLIFGNILTPAALGINTDMRQLGLQLLAMETA